MYLLDTKNHVAHVDPKCSAFPNTVNTRADSDLLPNNFTECKRCVIHGAVAPIKTRPDGGPIGPVVELKVAWVEEAVDDGT